LALRLLARQQAWVTATELATQNAECWRPLARALRRLVRDGAVHRREISVKDDCFRTRVRHEYKLVAETPLLIKAPRFDPSKFTIVGVRVHKEPM
jgi:hypothetical protein